MRKLFVTVSSRRVTFRFEAILHSYQNEGDFRLSLGDFYQRWGKEIPKGDHFEIEIVEGINTFVERYTLNVVREEKTLKPFVRYPFHIPSPEKALEIFKVWCVVAVGIITESAEIHSIFSNEPAQYRGKFFEITERVFDIKIEESSFGATLI